MTEDQAGDRGVEQAMPDKPPADAPVELGKPEKPEKPPLNPAHAILVGAVLSAIAGLSATFLNIRSSERLSTEKDKAAVAAEVQAKRQAEWDAKVADLQKQLDVANSRIETLIANSGPGTVPVAAPLPSIVVVIPQATSAVPQAVRPVEPTSLPTPTPGSTMAVAPGSTTTTLPVTTSVALTSTSAVTTRP